MKKKHIQVNDCRVHAVQKKKMAVGSMSRLGVVEQLLVTKKN